MFRGTTILAIKKNGITVLAGDGQVTFGDSVLKGNAKKVRRIFNNNVITGFAGATADAFTLLEKFEAKMEEFNGNLKRAAIELAKEWRMDKMLRKLEAMLIVADKDSMFLLSGVGDVIEPENNILAIGSGSNFARASAMALMEFSDLPPDKIALESLKIASEICIYTNKNIIVESIGGK